MPASGLITLRQGLEAASILGMMLAVLRKMARADRSGAVRAGVLAAVLASIAAESA